MSAPKMTTAAEQIVNYINQIDNAYCLASKDCFEPPLYQNQRPANISRFESLQDHFRGVLLKITRDELLSAIDEIIGQRDRKLTEMVILQTQSRLDLYYTIPELTRMLDVAVEIKCQDNSFFLVHQLICRYKKDYVNQMKTLIKRIPDGAKTDDCIKRCLSVAKPWDFHLADLKLI